MIRDKQADTTVVEWLKTWAQVHIFNLYSSGTFAKE